VAKGTGVSTGPTIARDGYEWIRAALVAPFEGMVRDHPLRLSVAGAAAVTLLAVTAFTPYFETNDDVVMNLVAAGLVVGDRPDEHLLYSNVLIGLPLKALYGACPAVPWYGLYQLATLAVAAGAAGYALLRVNPSARQAAVVLLFLVVVVLPCQVGLQFTKTAFLASFAGLMLLLAPLRGASPRWPRSADVAGVALLTLGSMVRFDSFLMAVVLLVPVAAAGAVAAPGRAVRRAIPVAVAAALAVALSVGNRAYYARSPGWEDFYAYNSLRVGFTDYDRYADTRETKPALDAVGWERVDLDMMRNYCFADRDRYSLARLRQFAAAAPRNPGPAAGQVTLALLRDLPRYPDLFILLIAVAGAALLTGTGWRQSALPALLVAAGFGLTVFLRVNFYLPPRVAFCLFAGVLAAVSLRPGEGAAFHRGAPGARRAGLVRAAGLVAVAVLVPWGVKLAAARQAEAREVHVTMNRVLRVLKPRPDQLFVLWREWLHLEAIVYPLEDLRGLRDFRCVWLSVLLRTPVAERRLRDFGITDLCRAICERPDVYVVAGGSFFPMFQYYMHRRYGIETTCEVVFPVGARGDSASGSSTLGLVVYRLREVDSTGAADAARRGGR
jgi:hypothetical protein